MEICACPSPALALTCSSSAIHRPGIPGFSGLICSHQAVIITSSQLRHPSSASLSRYTRKRGIASRRDMHFAVQVLFGLLRFFGARILNLVVKNCNVCRCDVKNHNLSVAVVAEFVNCAYFLTVEPLDNADGISSTFW